MERKEKVFEGFVLDIYDEYIDFMGVDKNILPRINPVKIECEEDDYNLVTPAYVSFDKLVGECADIYFSIDAFNLHPRERNSIFYHEFTHVFDANVTFRNCSNDDRFMYLRTFSEFNASVVGMLYNIGFDKLSEVNNLNVFMRTAYYHKEEISVSEYARKPIDIIRQIIRTDKDEFFNLSEEEYLRKYKVFHNETMYYLGHKYVYESLFGEKLYWREADVFGRFHEIVLEIEKHLRSKAFPKIVDPELELYRLFKETYSNKTLK